jgi:hypothetical protein
MIDKSIGLPVENAIGTQVMTTWVEHDKGSEFRREHAFADPVNDEKGKPVNHTLIPKKLTFLRS